jgi:hypothetical protein
MDTAIVRWYGRFRKAGMPANHALHAARVEVEFARLEDAGLVRISAEPDEDEYDPGDCLEGMSEESQRRFWDRINNLGVWGTVGEYRTHPEGYWETGDSCWGHAGYQYVLDPLENWYVTDIKAGTIGALKAALRGRCHECRKAA